MSKIGRFPMKKGICFTAVLSPFTAITEAIMPEPPPNYKFIPVVPERPSMRHQPP
jgi:hypothetical protein